MGTAKRNPRRKEKNHLSISTTTTPSEVEKNILSLYRENASKCMEITLARNLSKNMMVDTWVAILLATAIRNRPKVTVRDHAPLNKSSQFYEDYFCQSVPALTALAFGAELVSSDRQPLPIHAEGIESAICSRSLPLPESPDDDPFTDLLPEPPPQRRQQKIDDDGGSQEPVGRPLKTRGLLHTARGASTTVCEFDPNRSLADVFSGGAYPLRTVQQQTLFRERILQFRRDLEFGASQRGMRVGMRGSLLLLTEFLAELHENSHDYGQYGRPAEATGDRPVLPGVRFLRLRKYVGSKSNLLDRASDLPPLRSYLDRSLTGKNSVVIEASVSDFGLGIIDFVKTSASSMRYANETDRALLSLIFEGRVTSKEWDPAAGAGIFKALQAAQKMSGFISLRTGPFWLHWGFPSGEAKNRMEPSDMLEGQNLAKVVGTHWAFFYHQNIDYDPMLGREELLEQTEGELVASC